MLVYSWTFRWVDEYTGLFSSCMLAPHGGKSTVQSSTGRSSIDCRFQCSLLQWAWRLGLPPFIVDYVVILVFQVWDHLWSSEKGFALRVVSSELFAVMLHCIRALRMLYHLAAELYWGHSMTTGSKLLADAAAVSAPGKEMDRLAGEQYTTDWRAPHPCNIGMARSGPLHQNCVQNVVSSSCSCTFSGNRYQSLPDNFWLTVLIDAKKCLQKRIKNK